MTGIDPLAVRAPRVRDRSGTGVTRIRFTSAILPPYARRSKRLEVLIPVLYLKGVSTGDFAEALAALLERPRAVEKKVLEEVGDSGLARRLVGRADRVPHHVGDDRSTPIGDHHHLQTVVQGGVVRLDIQRPGG